MRQKYDLTVLTALVVSSFVSRNTVRSSDLPKLINFTHTALAGLRSAQTAKCVKRVPAVPVGESVTRDYIVCLEDGRRLKTLKRHIRREYSLSPDEYRARWHLPSDYPMVAPAYSELRSSLAKRKPAPTSQPHVSAGLGEAAPEEAAPDSGRRSR